MTTSWSVRAGIAAALVVLAVGQASARPARNKPAVPSDVASAKAALVDSKVASDASAMSLAVGAAARLGQTGDPAGRGALLDGLVTGLHPQVAAAALAALAHKPNQADAEVVRLFAMHRNAAVRAAAVSVLVAYPDLGSRELLVRSLGDHDAGVRGAAANAVATAKHKAAVPRLTKLMIKGELSAADALARLADVDLSASLAELLGTAPDAALAQCLGGILKRDDFGPEPARVQLVRAIAKISGPEAVAALSDYLDATAKDKARPSRREAEAAVEARMGGS